MKVLQGEKHHHVIQANTSPCQRGGIWWDSGNSKTQPPQTRLIIAIQRASGQQTERVESVSKERELIHELIWRGDNGDMSFTGKEPAADGGWVQGMGGGQRDKAFIGPSPTITWSYQAFSVWAPQLAAKLADRRPIWPRKEWKRAINGNKCWVLLLLSSFVKAVGMLKWSVRYFVVC